MPAARSVVSQYWSRSWTLVDGVFVKVWQEKEMATDGKVVVGNAVRLEATGKYQPSKSAPESFALKFTVETKYDGHRCIALNPKLFITKDPKTPTEIKNTYLVCAASSDIADPAKRFKRWLGTILSFILLVCNTSIFVVCVFCSCDKTDYRQRRFTGRCRVKRQIDSEPR